MRPRLFRGTCYHCRCQIECDEKEAGYDSERQHKWHFLCPTLGCCQRIDLKEVVLREDGPLKKQAPIGGKVGDLASQLTRTMDTWHKIQKGLLPKSMKDVHTEHCCIRHGCKYGKDDECTVMTKRAPQRYICERCEEDGLRDLTDLRLVLSGTTQTCPYCQHTLP